MHSTCCGPGAIPNVFIYVGLFKIDDIVVHSHLSMSIQNHRSGKSHKAAWPVGGKAGI